MKSIELKKKECQTSLYQFLQRYSKDTAKRYMFTEECSYSFMQIKEKVESLAIAFDFFGVKKGSLVALRATRSVDTAVIYLALNLIGAVSVMTDPHMGVKEYIISSGVDIKPDFYVTNETPLMDVDGSGNWILKNDKFITVCPIIFSLPKKIDGEKIEELANKVEVTDPTLIIFTSGSTGKKKAVTLCQRNIVTNSVDGGDLLGENTEDSTALILPLYHVFGIATFVCPLVNGHSVYIPKNAHPESLLKDIKKHRITILYSVPTYALNLAELCKREGAPDTLKFILLAGGPSTLSQVIDVEKSLNTIVVPVYGMSEFIGISCGAILDESKRRVGVGKFYPLNDGGVFDRDGNLLPKNVEGEVCIKGWDLMLGYYNDEEETKKVIDKNGYLHTGDLGYVDDDGVLRLTGRIKEIIIRGGENVSARKIELAVLALNYVSQVAVVAVKHPVLGEVPLATIVLKNNQKPNVDAIKRTLRTKLSPIEIPEYFSFVDALPLTSSGKIDKIKIAETFKVD